MAMGLFIRNRFLHKNDRESLNLSERLVYFDLERLSPHPVRQMMLSYFNMNNGLNHYLA